MTVQQPGGTGPTYGASPAGAPQPLQFNQQQHPANQPMSYSAMPQPTQPAFMPPGGQPVQSYQPQLLPNGKPMGRWARGRRLYKLSYAILKDDKDLFLLPILSAVSMILMVLVFGLPALIGAIELHAHGSSAGAISTVGYVLLVPMYLAVSFSNYFFGAALIAGATMKLNGQQATVGMCLREAGKHAGKIFLWSVISCTVGLILNAIERHRLVGAIIGGIIGVAWSILTSFIVPVLIYENLGVVGSIKRSGQIIKQRWGENLAGGISLIGGVFLWMLAGIAISIVLLFVLPVVGLFALFLAIGIPIVVASAVGGVFKAALYQFAVTGQSPAFGGFTTDDFMSAYRQKRGLFRR